MSELENLNRFNRYYDLMYGHRDDDLEMWLTLTDDIHGEILEIGCGTGRVTLPLLQQGHRITGIDISAEAIQVVRAKVETENLGKLAAFHTADMRSLDLPKKDFALALVPINTFMHCLSLSEQEAALHALYQHLQPGGILVIDLFHPAPQQLLEADGQLILEGQTIVEETGHTLQWFVTRHLDLAKQIQEVTLFLDETAIDGTLNRNLFSFSLRYIHHFEMVLLLQNAGFQLREVLGDYDLSPFTSVSPCMIFIAQR